MARVFIEDSNVSHADLTVKQVKVRVLISVYYRVDSSLNTLDIFFLVLLRCNWHIALSIMIQLIPFME